MWKRKIKSVKELKILMVIALFHPYIGGSEKQAQKLALGLMGSGAQVSVVTGRWSNHLKRCENIVGIKVIRNRTNFKYGKRLQLDTGADFFKPDLAINGRKQGFIKVLFNKIFIRLSIYIYQISLFIFLISFRKNYDIIHVHQVLYPAFVSTLCARILKKPVIAKAGSSGFNSDINQIKKFPEGRLQLKFILRNIDRIVCTTSKMMEEFLTEGVYKDKIVLIPNGVNILNLKRSFEKCSSVLYLGRFTKTKDINTLVLAFSRIILNNYTDLRLVLLGDGPESGNIVKMINEYNLKENVSLAGFVDDPNTYLRETDLYVLPSLIEGLSNSLIEAMSYKLPCIASNIPGNVAVISDNTSGYNIEKGGFVKTRYGILFNPGDVEGLFNSIKFLIDNPDERKELGESAFGKVKSEYDINAIAGKYNDLYTEILK